MSSEHEIIVIGAGLAGCEAAWQAAQSGCRVKLYEMKPQRFSPAHTSEGLAELVCSNSLKADGSANSSGVLKEELRILDSLVIRQADASRVPAGAALAVSASSFLPVLQPLLSNIRGLRLYAVRLQQFHLKVSS